MGDDTIIREEYISEFIEIPNVDYLIEIHPECRPTHFILDILDDLGYVSMGGMDYSVLQYSEIKAYLDLMEIRLSPEYIKLIHLLSIVYLSYLKTDKDEPHPITNEAMGGMTKTALAEIRNL